MALKYSITYNGNIWNSSTDLDSILLQNGSVTSSISSEGTKTLNCSGKYMTNNLIIGEKTLNCANKIMAGNVVITAENSTPTTKLYMYNCDNGSISENRCPSNTGGYDIFYGWNYLGSRGYLNETNDYMDFGDNDASSYGGTCVQINNLIDVTNYTKMCCDGYMLYDNESSSGLEFGLCRAHTSSHHTMNVECNMQSRTSTRTTLELDISSKTGSFYPYWTCNSGSWPYCTGVSRIYKVWFE